VRSCLIPSLYLPSTCCLKLKGIASYSDSVCLSSLGSGSERLGGVEVVSRLVVKGGS